jgi:RNA polymerase sigma-70 factor (ECF subfamily)
MAPSAEARGCRASRAERGRAEDELLLRLRAGDAAAFEELVRREGGRLLAVARRILRDEAQAQDAVQDAFLSAFRKLDGFAEQARLSTWLHRIAINAALVRLRSRRRRREHSIEPLLPRFDPDGHFSDPGPVWRAPGDAVLARKETAELVGSCIDRLPESHRTVLLLRDVEGLDSAEAAAALGIGVDAAKMRLHRARQALRTLLEPHLRQETSE